MLISHKHKFITIDIPKTGSLSRKLALIKYCDVVGRQQEDPFYQHDTASCLKDKFVARNWPWNDYFKYVTIRNPWARFASNYVWGKNVYQQNINKKTEHIKPGVIPTFVAFKQLFTIFKNNPQKIMQRIIDIQPSQDQYFVSNEDILVDYVSKLETIDYDFQFLCLKVGIHPLPVLENNNKNTSIPYDYKNIYNQELIDMVAKKEKYIIDNYGYQY